MNTSDPIALNSADPLERDLRGSAPPSTDVPDVCEAAAAAGLLDVAYATLDSPLGRLLLASTPRGLVRVAYVDYDEENAVLEELAAKVSPRVLAAAWKLDEPRRELDQYFAGRRQSFEVPLDWRLTRGFARRVLEATAKVPYGGTATYKHVATEAGNAKAFRAAGNALGSNPIPIIVPCHRILHSGGGLGGYTGGVEKKRLLLAVESGQTAAAV
jgi:methylated-DNA-[protein]-cysteine S-methyltransferase